MLENFDCFSAAIATAYSDCYKIVLTMIQSKLFNNFLIKEVQSLIPWIVAMLIFS